MPQNGRYKWWGKFQIPEGRSRHWRIGPLTLCVSRLPSEWRVSRSNSGNPSDDAIEVGVLGEPAPTDSRALVSRYATSGSADELRVMPILPDRSVVSCPERPISVLPRQNVTIFVGSPLFISLEETPHTPLGELPAVTPTQTWWGPNTMEGERCYATRTHGRLRSEDAAQYPHRAITAVDVHNAAEEPLLVERLNLPVRRLALYSGRDGRLWTQAVRLERSSAEEFAALHIDEGAPDEANGAELLARARDTGSEHMLFRAFGSLFKW